MAKYKIYKFFHTDWPISQKYGERPEYYKQFGLTGHEGVDYATPNGTPLLSPFDGVILRDNDSPKASVYGNFLVVWDPIQKCALWFCHLQSNLVSVGDRVKAGQTLGFTNNTGNSSGPHCHVNFVETDAVGNRLNMKNGNQGFLDLLAYCDFTLVPAVVPQPKPIVEEIPTPLQETLKPVESVVVQTPVNTSPTPEPVQVPTPVVEASQTSFGEVVGPIVEPSLISRIIRFLLSALSKFGNYGK